MSYHKRGSSTGYLVVRKQGISPVRRVRHGLTKTQAEREAKLLNEIYHDRPDIHVHVREERYNRKNWSS